MGVRSRPVGRVVWGLVLVGATGCVRAATDGDTDLGDATDLPDTDTGEASNTDTPDPADTDGIVDTDALAAPGPGLAADPCRLELPAELIRADVPLYEETSAALSDAQALLDAVLADVAAARAQVVSNGCGPEAVAWRDGVWYPTVHAATVGMDAGAVVLVCGGEHTEAIRVVSDRTLAPLDPGDPVTLRSTGDDSVVWARPGARLGLVDVDVVGASDDPQAAIRVDAGGDAVLARVRVMDHTTVGLQISRADLAVVCGSTFTGITTPDSKAVGASMVVARRAVLFSNTYQANVAENFGGGVHLQHGDEDVADSLFVLARNRFVRNQTRAVGGAVHAGSTFETLRLVQLGNRFARNEAVDGGGAERLGPDGGTFVSVGDVFVGNRAVGGGAVEVGDRETVDTTIVDVLATDNTGFSAFAFSPFRPDDTASLRLLGGWFARNDTTEGAITWSEDWDVTGVDVGFGTGVDANLRGDVVACGPLPAVASWHHPAHGTCEVEP